MNPAHTNRGYLIDAFQRRAREGAGIEVPRPPAPPPDRVEGIVAEECRKCGCTGTRLRSQKRMACGFCGAIQ